MASGRTGARGVGEHAERERMPFVHASLAHHRGRHRQGEMFLKPGKGRARRGEVHAAARDDHGVTAGKQTFRHAAHGIQRRHDRIKRIMAERDAPLFGLRRHTEHVVGEQEHDGAGRPEQPPRRPDPRSPPRGPPYVPASSTWSRPRTDGHGRIPETHCDPHSSTGSPEA